MGFTSSSQSSDETIRHEQDGLPDKSGLEWTVKESKQFGTESATATYLLGLASIGMIPLAAEDDARSVANTQ
jgi:hypothetical protein